MILPQLTWRMLRYASFKTLWNLGLHCGLANIRAIHRFNKGLQRGDVFPPFLFLSITNRCNLRCQGCWVATDAPKTELSLDELATIIAAARKHNCRFFGILGGEPLLHDGLLDLFGRHRDCTFQLFTNGTLLTPEVARELRRLGNVTPLISIEGGASVSDIRRGGSGVLERSLVGLENATREKLFTGVATSVCKSNLDELVSEAWLAELIRRRALYVWYYLYRPAGANPCTELALDAREILRVRRFLVEQRCKQPILIVDSYWDADGRALCPAATGISHHVSPAGFIEPCPPIQFARDHIHDNDGDLTKTLTESEFLADFRRFAAGQTRGCVLLDCPEELADFLDAHDAIDTSLRGASTDDLRALPALPCHHLPGREIPEAHWAYRFAKRHWFFGFGAYG